MVGERVVGFADGDAVLDFFVGDDVLGFIVGTKVIGLFVGDGVVNLSILGCLVGREVGAGVRIVTEGVGLVVGLDSSPTGSYVTQIELMQTLFSPQGVPSFT